MDDDTAPESSQSGPGRAVLAATIGNALEFYDFMVFALFAIQIGQAFFPSHDAYASLMASLATFGAGFISRPLGAWVIGGYGDRKGRRPALMLSMVLMGVGILGIALTPGYDRIGIAAPIIAVAARLVQGFALGGEVGPATAYMLENARSGRRGLVISLQRVSQLVATLLGSLVGLVLGALLEPAQFNAYGWRIALLLGASIIPFGLWIRRSLPETVHLPDPEPAAGETGTPPFARTVMLGSVLVFAGTVSAYVLVYLTTFAQATLKLSPALAMTGQSLANLVGIAVCLASGAISDRIGRRPVIIVSLLAATAISPLAFAWMIAAPGAFSFLLSSMIFAGAISAFNTPANTAIAESLPRHRRAMAFSLVYSIPVAVFGGTTQLVVTWLLHNTGNSLAVVWYPMAAMLAGAGAAWAMVESAPRRQRQSAGPALAA